MDTLDHLPAAEVSPAANLWRHRDFLRLWAGQTISQLGSTVTREALPYTAILTLQASPLQMGLLGAAGAMPLLIVGLFAGVWVDRVRRRPLLIAADLGRALLLLSVPVAYLLGWLTITQLYLVAALSGVLTVFFSIAYQSYLPDLVQRQHLVEANSKLGLSDSLAEIAGPPLGGALVQLASGPIALVLDGLSFVVSALALHRVRAAEPPPAARPAGGHPPLRQELSAGLRAIWASPLLRPLAIGSVIRNFFGWFFGAIYGLYALRTLGLTPVALGLTVACGGVGALLGALLVRPALRRLGPGWTIIGAGLVGAVMNGLIWLAGGMPGVALPLLVASQLVGDAMLSASLITQTSLRQTITPAALLGRVSAGMGVLSEGVGALGLLTGGLLAELIGLRATVGLAGLGVLAAALWLAASPIRQLRVMPPPATPEG